MTKIQCNKCKSIIFSKHLHDMVWCDCKCIAIDGGNDYCKITGSDYEWIESSLIIGNNKEVM